jgi:hypothetical protein
MVEAAGVAPSGAIRGRPAKPDRGADTTTERSKGVVEAAGVEPASERPVAVELYVRIRP